MTPTQPLDIGKLKELLARATQPPWVVCGVRGKAHHIGKNAVFHDIGPDGTSVAAVWFDTGSGLGFMDAKLIVAAVNALPSLILMAERVERLEADFRALDQAVSNSIRETGEPHRVLWEGQWYDGPAAEIANSILRAVQRVARNALSPTTTEDQHG